MAYPLSYNKQVPFLYPCVPEEPVGFVVDDQGFREVCFSQQGKGITIVGHGETDVRIAAQDDRHFVLLTQAQDFDVVVPCLLLLSHRIHA